MPPDLLDEVVHAPFEREAADDVALCGERYRRCNERRLRYIVLRATPWEAGDDIVAVRGAHDEHEHEHEDDDPLQHELKRD